MNAIPKFVKKIEIPIKPLLPENYNYNKDIDRYWLQKKDCEMYDLLTKAFQIRNMNVSYHYLHSVDKLNECKKKFENEYKKEYENNFNEYYEKYRLQYYRDIIKKYCNDNHYVNVKK